MNAATRIPAALNSVGIPYRRLKYTNPPAKYVTFFIYNDAPQSASGKIRTEIEYAQVDLWTKEPIDADKATIKAALRDAGIKVSGAHEYYEDDTGITHVMFDCIVGEG
jgi:hypothetical protein